jgi:heme exporter protein A
MGLWSGLHSRYGKCKKISLSFCKPFLDRGNISAFMTPSPLLHMHVPLLVRGGRPLLQNFSLQVFCGDSVHITGPNGVGKSSLLRAMAGLLPLQGPCVIRTPSVFFLPTERDIPDGQTGKAYLTLWRAFENHVLKDENPLPSLVSETTEALFLPKKILNQAIHRLSSGMQQRVRLARLAQTRSHLWILDEPWQSLDHDAAGILDDCIARHTARGGAVVWTHHGYRSFPFQPRIMDLSDFVPTTETEDPWPF